MRTRGRRRRRGRRLRRPRRPRARGDAPRRRPRAPPRRRLSPRPAYDTGMPELPELEALVEALDPLVSRAPVRDVPVAHFAVVKTATPPIAWLGGHPLEGARRRGKHLLFATDDDLVLTIHLMTGGQARVCRAGSKRPPGAVLAVHFEDDGELVVTERVTRKSGARAPAARPPSWTRSSPASAPSRSMPRSTSPRCSRARPRRAAAHAAARPARDPRHRARVRQRDPARGAALAVRAGRPRLAGGARAAARRDPQHPHRGHRGLPPARPAHDREEAHPEVYDIHGHAGESCPRCGRRFNGSTSRTTRSSIARRARRGGRSTRTAGARACSSSDEREGRSQSPSTEPSRRAAKHAGEGRGRAQSSADPGEPLDRDRVGKPNAPSLGRA